MTQGLQIGKVAEQTGLTIDTIRFYQKIGLIKQPARSQAGYRLFDKAELQDLEFVRKAQELGFSLNEIRELLVLKHQHVHTCSKVRELLKLKLTDVRGKLEDLLRLEKELNRALRKCNRDLRTNQGSSHGECCPVLDSLENENGKGRSRRS